MGHGKTKDYRLWFWAGQQVLHGRILSRRRRRLFRIHLSTALSDTARDPELVRQDPALFCLSILNVVAWWLTAQFSHAMAGSGAARPWLEALPGIVTVTFVFDMFDLGQPNLVLLAMML